MLETLVAGRAAPALKDTTRTAWIDMARGMAEVSVVTLHIMQAMSNAGLTPPGLFDWWTPVGDMIRMPLMMFIAGLFVEHSLRKGPRDYFKGKLQRVVWPYLIWAHVYQLYWYYRPPPMKPVDMTDVFLTVVHPLSHLWFLQVLFIYYVVIFFLLKRGIWLPLGVGLIGALLTPWMWGNNEIQRIPYLFLFFVFGIGFNRILKTRGFPFGPYVGAALVVLAVALPVLITDYFGYSKYLPQALPASIIGVGACLAIARACVYVPGVNRLLALFGTFSLEIYCAHLIFSSAMRRGLVRFFDIHDFWTLFLLSTMAGLFMPIVLTLVLRRLGLDVLFEWPKHLFRREKPAIAQNF
jgi:fucose 4-O-acetylase-like acetyltransferase